MKTNAPPGGTLGIYGAGLNFANCDVSPVKRTAITEAVKLDEMLNFPMGLIMPKEQAW